MNDRHMFSVTVTAVGRDIEELKYANCIEYILKNKLVWKCMEEAIKHPNAFRRERFFLDDIITLHCKGSNCHSVSYSTVKCN